MKVLGWIVSHTLACHLFEKVSNEDKSVFPSCLSLRQPCSRARSCFLQPMKELHYFGLGFAPLAVLTHASAGYMVMDFPLRMFQNGLPSVCGGEFRFRQGLLSETSNGRAEYGRPFGHALFILGVPSPARHPFVNSTNLFPSQKGRCQV